MQGSRVKIYLRTGSLEKTGLENVGDFFPNKAFDERPVENGNDGKKGQRDVKLVDVLEKLISSKRRRYLNFDIGLKRDEIKSFTKIGLREKSNG